MSLLKAYEQRFQPFKAEEAWLLFRLGAYGEAVGWTILISGIILKHSLFHGNDLPVLIAGQIHGTLFILYMVAALLTYPSLAWPRWQAALAIMMSVPPYGSVIFERLVAAHRFKQRSQQRQAYLTYKILSQHI